MSQGLTKLHSKCEVLWKGIIEILNLAGHCGSLHFQRILSCSFPSFLGCHLNYICNWKAIQFISLFSPPLYSLKKLLFPDFTFFFAKYCLNNLATMAATAHPLLSSPFSTVTPRLFTFLTMELPEWKFPSALWFILSLPIRKRKKQLFEPYWRDFNVEWCCIIYRHSPYIEPIYFFPPEQKTNT